MAAARGLAAAVAPTGTPTLIVEQKGPYQVLVQAPTGPPGEQAVAFWGPALPPGSSS